MSQIKSVIESFDPAGPQYEDQKDMIDALAQLADAMADSFALQIEKSIAAADSEFNKTLPVEAWIDTIKETHAISNTGASDVINRVADGVKKFVQGVSGTPDPTSIIDGVGNMLGTAVDVFLGAGTASDDKLERMVIYMSGFGVERLDFKYGSERLRAKASRKKCQKSPHSLQSVQLWICQKSSSTPF